MAITTDTVFNQVYINCSCDEARVSTVIPKNNGSTPTGGHGIAPSTTDADEIAELTIMRDAVIAGDASVIYRDRSTLIPYADLPIVYAPYIHPKHSIHPNEGWKSLVTMVLNADVTEDADTGRSDILTQFGVVPEKRQPDGTTYAYPLDQWSVRLVSGVQISIERDWTADDNVTDPNAHDDVIGLFAWLEAHRISGTAFGDDILALDDVTGRTIELDQGTGLATLDLHVTSIGHNVDGGVYSHVGISLQRITGETDAIDIAAIREIFMTATGTITVASDDAPEAPPFGATDIGIRAAYIELPDGKRIEPVGERIVLRQPSLGRTPLDGSGRRIVRYDDLDDLTSLSKYMPTDGARVVHFGHGAAAMGNLVFDSVADHTLSESIGEVYEVRNLSDEYDVEVHDPDGGVLVNLKPGQSCAFEVAEENADGDEEIIAIRPPTRRIEWQRGLALPDFDGQMLYSADSTGWLSLPWGSNVLKYRDNDGFTVGSAALPTPTDGLMSNVAAADWDIPGSFAIVSGGLVRLDLRYHLLLDADPPTSLAASLALGHGISLWISEGGTETLTRQGFVGLPEISAIGDIADCGFRYTGVHSAGTRFLMLHRIPTGSILGTDDDHDAYYDQVDLEAITSSAELDPIIRWTSS